MRIAFAAALLSVLGTGAAFRGARRLERAASRVAVKAPAASAAELGAAGEATGEGRGLSGRALLGLGVFGGAVGPAVDGIHNDAY